MRKFTAVLTVFEIPPELAREGVTRSAMYEVVVIEAPSLQQAPDLAKAAYRKALAEVDEAYDGVDLKLVALFSGEQRAVRSDCEGVTVRPRSRKKTEGAENA